MWQIKDPEVQPTILDFGSSGQGKHHGFQLVLDNTVLINAIELVDWDEEPTQFPICEACGYVHCKRGDWVSLRRAGPMILLLPTLEFVEGEGDDRMEYRPPEYIFKKGIPYLNLATYDSLRVSNTCFPSADSFRRMNMREAILTFQWDAPLQLFGRPPQPFAHRSECVIGSSIGDHTEYIGQLEEFARANGSCECEISLRQLNADEPAVSLYLDGPEFIEWKALTYDEGRLQLILDSKYVVLPDADAV